MSNHQTRVIWVLIAAVVVGFVAAYFLVGCVNDTATNSVATNYPTTLQIMQEARQGLEVAVVRSIVEKWVAAGRPVGDDGVYHTGAGDPRLVWKSGDDDLPNIMCDLAGAPIKQWSKNGVTKWTDVCGNEFWQVDLDDGTEVCIGSAGAVIYECNGFGKVGVN